MKYSDCYPGCGGEDCPCCEIHVDHQHDNDFDPYYDDVDDMRDYDYDEE